MSGALPPNHPKLNPRSTLSTLSNVTPGPPRAIQPHQNWLARFLRVKPAVATMCFQVSKVRARREIASLLREWRKYGIRDIVVDKNMSRIWAKVARNNCAYFAPLPFPSKTSTNHHQHPQLYTSHPSPLQSNSSPSSIAAEKQI